MRISLFLLLGILVCSTGCSSSQWVTKPVQTADGTLHQLVISERIGTVAQDGLILQTYEQKPGESHMECTHTFHSTDSGLFKYIGSGIAQGTGLAVGEALRRPDVVKNTTNTDVKQGGATNGAITTNADSTGASLGKITATGGGGGTGTGGTVASGAVKVVPTQINNQQASLLAKLSQQSSNTSGSVALSKASGGNAKTSGGNTSSGATSTATGTGTGGNQSQGQAQGQGQRQGQGQGQDATGTGTAQSGVDSGGNNTTNGG